MAEKSLAEMTAKQFDSDAKMVKISSVIVTIGVIIGVYYLLRTLTQAATETQVSFTLILAGFAIVAVFLIAVALWNVQMRLRRDLFDVMQEVRRSD